MTVRRLPVGSARIVSADDSTPPGARLCVFTLGDTRYAMPVTSVREVMVIEDVTPVPRAAAHVLGVANLRGDIVTLVSIEPLLGRAPRPPRRGARALVLADPALRVAVVVDDVVDLAAPRPAEGIKVLDPSRMLARLKSEEVR
jgi:chemotaxis signal transduction protein